MNWSNFKEVFTLENMLKLLEDYADLGPIPGLLLPLIESFLPFLPVVIFVMANAAAFGFWKGFLISWIGACLGAYLVFLIIRRLGQQRFFHFIRKHGKVRKLMNWVERHGFGPLFLLLCFPFSPSAIINVVAALSRIGIYQFLLAVLLGKAVMIGVVSFIGHDLISLINEPVKTAVLLISIFVLWYGGKLIEARLQTKAKVQYARSNEVKKQK